MVFSLPFIILQPCDVAVAEFLSVVDFGKAKSFVFPAELVTAPAWSWISSACNLPMAHRGHLPPECSFPSQQRENSHGKCCNLIACCQAVWLELSSPKPKTTGTCRVDLWWSHLNISHDFCGLTPSDSPSAICGWKHNSNKMRKPSGGNSARQS